MTKSQSKKLKVRELPLTLIIDKDFNFIYKHVGLNEEKESNIVFKVWDKKIQELL